MEDPWSLVELAKTQRLPQTFRRMAELRRSLAPRRPQRAHRRPRLRARVDTVDRLRALRRVDTVDRRKVDLRVVADLVDLRAADSRRVDSAGRLRVEDLGDRPPVTINRAAAECSSTSSPAE